MTPDEYDRGWAIEEAMQQMGGGFVQALGKALRTADPMNKAKLLDAFPEYVAQYRKIAEHHNWYQDE